MIDCLKLIPLKFLQEDHASWKDTKEGKVKSRLFACSTDTSGNQGFSLFYMV